MEFYFEKHYGSRQSSITIKSYNRTTYSIGNIMQKETLGYCCALEPWSAADLLSVVWCRMWRRSCVVDRHEHQHRQRQVRQVVLRIGPWPRQVPDNAAAIHGRAGARSSPSGRQSSAEMTQLVLIDTPKNVSLNFTSSFPVWLTYRLPYYTTQLLYSATGKSPFETKLYGCPRWQLILSVVIELCSQFVLKLCLSPPLTECMKYSIPFVIWG